ncbi:hypothetical protein, partial [Reinekea sp.]
ESEAWMPKFSGAGRREQRPLKDDLPPKRLVKLPAISKIQNRLAGKLRWEISFVWESEAWMPKFSGAGRREQRPLKGDLPPKRLVKLPAVSF